MKISRRFLRFCFAYFIIFTSLTLQAANLPPGFAEILVAQDLDPTAMALTPDGRIFLLEKSGRVRVVENGQLLTDPLLTIDVDNYNERGLSGIAIDPDFAQNGYFYLYYTVKNENHNRVSRFMAEGNFAPPASETVLVNLNQLAGTIHNAGSMAFGIDGKLYVSVGDGSDANNAQNMNSLLGKVLRINPDGSIPADNPFYNQATGVNRAIYALGFRNSFSMTIQPGTGRIFATEVGNGAWEEVNEIQAGKNYGWPIIEGPLNGQTPPANYKEPVFAYDHGQGCAAVGATFYNPATALFPAEYAGKFFFADYCGGYIKYLNPNVPGTANIFATGINRPLNMLTAPDGTLYYLARAGIGGGSQEDNTTTTDGALWRVFYTGNGAPFVSVQPRSALISQGESVTFVMAASGEPPLQFQWQRDGSNIPGATDSLFVFDNAMLSDSGSVFRCIVSNTQGADTTQAALLGVTANHRPQPEILTPLAGTQYRAGDILEFSGAATDADEGVLSPEKLRWKIDFHHDEHTHPGLTPTSGITSGQYQIPTVGETSSNVWYKVHLTATDAGGLSKTVTREIFPAKTQFNVLSDPPGLPVYVEGNYLQTPVSVTSVVGVFRELIAVGSVATDDSIYLFKQWSDGLFSRDRTFTAPEDTLNFTAVYESYPAGKGTGLQGYYYDGPMYDPTFYEPYKFSRIDPTVDFDWHGGSPNLEFLGEDFWLVRWEGYVETLFPGIYNFHVFADDGVRLWVAGVPVIDQWVPQAPTEATGSINLLGSTLYPIRLEYFEEGGGAVCKLLWSSTRLEKSIIPKSQLYPERPTIASTVEDLPVKVYPNPAGDALYIDMENPHAGAFDLELVNTLGQVVLQQRERILSDVRIDISRLPAGMYWLRIAEGNQPAGMVKVVKL